MPLTPPGAASGALTLFYKRSASQDENTERLRTRLKDMKYRIALALVLVGVLGFASVGVAAGRGGQGGGAAGHGGGPAVHSGAGGFHGSAGAFHGHSGEFHGHPGAFHDHPRFHGRGFVGVAPFVWAPGYVYEPPVMEAPPVYVPGSDGYWYYCQSAGAYYPIAPSCPEPWVPVLAN